VMAYRPKSCRLRRRSVPSDAGSRCSPSDRSWRWRTLVEGGLDAIGLGLGHEALVLVIGDGLGLVDEHDGDVVANGVAPFQARVVQGVLVLEVQEATLFLRARQ